MNSSLNKPLNPTASSFQPTLNPNARSFLPSDNTFSSREEKKPNEEKVYQILQPIKKQENKIERKYSPEYGGVHQNGWKTKEFRLQIKQRLAGAVNTKSFKNHGVVKTRFIIQSSSKGSCAVKVEFDVAETTLGNQLPSEDLSFSFSPRSHNAPTLPQIDNWDQMLARLSDPQGKFAQQQVQQKSLDERRNTSSGRSKSVQDFVSWQQKPLNKDALNSSPLNRPSEVCKWNYSTHVPSLEKPIEEKLPASSTMLTQSIPRRPGDNLSKSSKHFDSIDNTIAITLQNVKKVNAKHDQMITKPDHHRKGTLGDNQSQVTMEPDKEMDSGKCSGHLGDYCSSWNMESLPPEEHLNQTLNGVSLDEKPIRIQKVVHQSSSTLDEALVLTPNEDTNKPKSSAEIIDSAASVPINDLQPIINDMITSN